MTLAWLVAAVVLGSSTQAAPRMALVAVGRFLKLADGSSSLLATGVQRVKILDYVQLEPFYKVRVIPIFEPNDDSVATEALIRAVRSLFEQCAQMGGHVPDDVFNMAVSADHAGALADIVASTLKLSASEKQELLETLDPAARLQIVHAYLSKEVKVMELEHKIHDRVHEEIDKSQREYFLREQLRVIQTELGEGSAHYGEYKELHDKLSQIQMPDEVTHRAERALEMLVPLQPASP